MILSDEQIHNFSKIIETVFHLIDEEQYLELEQYETYELFNRQITTLNLLKNKKQRLHIDKVNCYPSINYTITTSCKNHHVYNTTAKISLERYITDENNNIVAGTKDYIIDVLYNVSFIENNLDEDSKCLFCGASLEKGASRCDYCGSLTTLKDKNWIIFELEEIEVVDQLKKTKDANRKYMEEAWNKIFRDNKTINPL